MRAVVCREKAGSLVRFKCRALRSGGVFVFSLLASVSIACADIYVSPQGSPSGTGTEIDPLSLTGALARAADGMTIRLLAGHYVVSETIVVDKAVTIAGDLSDRRAAVVDGGGECRVFQLKAAGSALANLTVTNGVSGKAGGGVLLSQATVVTNCVVTHCTAATGGGIASDYATKWSPTVVDCEIAHCRGTNTSGGNDGGGGVLLANCMKLRKSVIRDCWCDRFGAICSWADKATCEVSDCVVTNNGANYCAGLGGTGCPRVSGTLFAGNCAKKGAGIAYSGKDQPHMTNVFAFCRFVGNVATNGDSGVFDVAAEGSQTLISNCVFNSNAASTYNAIGSCSKTGAAMSFWGCGFTNNVGRYEGGCLRGSGFKFENCSFHANRSEDQRGGVLMLLPGSPVTIRKCRFSENRSGTVANDAHGGAIFSQLTTGLTIEDSVFFGNVAKQRGGAVFCIAGSFRKCVFEENVAMGSFGAAVVCNDAGTNTFESCSFYANGSLNCGAVFSSGNHLLTSFADCRFYTNGVAGASGGALDLRSPFLIERCVFDGNRGGSGGAVNVSATGGNSRIVNSCFVRNDGSTDCGALYCNGPCLIENCTFFGNTVAAKTKNAAGVAMGGAAEMKNCILFGNYELGSMAGRDFLPLVSGSEGNVQTSCIGGWKDASGAVMERPPAGCISSDPLFVDGESGNFTLRRRSPCRDSGSTEPWMRAPNAFDLAGNVRVYGPTVDMGAYEYIPSSAGLMLIIH